MSINYIHKNMFSPLDESIIIPSLPIASFSSPKQVSSFHSRNVASPATNDFIKNNERSQVNLKKTKACDNVEKNGHCHRGNNCDYAHTLGELVYQPCGFGSNCFRRNRSNLRPGQKICTFKHPSETIQEHHNRIGTSIPRLPTGVERPIERPIERPVERQIERPEPSNEIMLEIPVEILESAIMDAIAQGFTSFHIKLL